MSGEPPALELAGISKSFGSVQALRGADFSLAPGEVHALLGENGAGKSTLLHIAYGLIGLDAGVIRVGGTPVTIRSPRDAQRLGLGMVHQHFTSIDALTVSENLALATGGRAGKSLGALPHGLMAGLAPGALVDTLSVALRQRLEIVKALATGATVLLLDEPSAVLAPAEVEELLSLVRRFVARGGAAALITHKLREVFLGADRVTVLRHGVVTLSAPIESESEESLARAMIGTRAGLTNPRQSKAVVPEPVVGQSTPVRFGNIELRAGELVGVAAITGNGQRGLLRGLAAGAGAALVPEDRTTEGLIPELSVTENVVLGLDHDPRWAGRFGIDWGAARKRTAELIEAFEIHAGSPGDLVRTLSGGNQQKVVLARALENRPRVLVAENPTRGLDIRATAFVHQQLRAAAAAGVIVVVYSTDLDEVLELGERILVVWNGRVVEATREAGREAIGRMMVGLDR